MGSHTSLTRSAISRKKTVHFFWRKTLSVRIQDCSNCKMTSQLQYYQAQLEKVVEQPGVVNELLTKLEAKTKVKKIYLAYGECGGGGER